MTHVTIIAEVGSVHDGSIGNAIEMVKLWADCGADAAKFQDHRFEEVDQDQQHPNPRVWNETRDDYYRRTEFAVWQWNILAAACKKRGVDFIVSPFSVEAAKEQADRATAFKVASGQLGNVALLAALRDIGKSVYMSSGMTTTAETFAAAEALGPALKYIMVCNSEYPSPPEHWSLRDVGPGTGYSDHSCGIVAPMLAAWQGASAIEVHVTPSRYLYGSDAGHSLEPPEFRQLVAGIRQIEVARASNLTRDEIIKTPEMQRMREVFLCPG